MKTGPHRPPHPMQHDSACKTLFSHPEMVTGLLRGYVREPWIDQLDFATLEKVNAHYVGEELQQREARTGSR